MLSLAGAIRMPWAVGSGQSPDTGILLTAIDAIKFRHNILILWLLFKLTGLIDTPDSSYGHRIIVNEIL